MHYFYMNLIQHDNGTYTTFMALDKTLKNRTYMYILDYYPEDQSQINDPEVYFDSEWMAITKNFNDHIPLKNDIFNYCNFFIEKNLYQEYMADFHKFIFKNQKHNIIYPESNFIDNLIGNLKTFKEQKVYSSLTLDRLEIPDRREAID
jgi:hypothetical protein